MLGAGSPEAPQYRFKFDLSLTNCSPLTLLKNLGGTIRKPRIIQGEMRRETVSAKRAGFFSLTAKKIWEFLVF